METDTQAVISQVIGRVPSGLWILTVRDETGRETGMLASWIQQASFDPPMVTVAVNNERYINEWLGQTNCAALSLLGESHRRFIGHFGNGFKPHEPAFDEIHVCRGETQVPVLAEALGWLEGKIVDRMPAGDHTVYLLQVTGAGVGPNFTDERPLVHIRKNGFRY